MIEQEQGITQLLERGVNAVPMGGRSTTDPTANMYMEMENHEYIMSQIIAKVVSRDGRQPQLIGTTMAGVGSVVGGLAIAVLAVEAVYRVTGSDSVASVVLSDPLAALVLPGVLVVGWVGLGALLLDGRALAIPVAAGAYLGAAGINSAALGTSWMDLGPTPVVDPVTYVPVLVGRLILGYPSGSFAGVSFPVVGTVVSMLLAVVLLREAVQNPTVQTELNSALRSNTR